MRLAVANCWCWPYDLGNSGRIPSRSSRAREPKSAVNRWVLSTRDKESSRPDFRGAEHNHGCAVPLWFQREDSLLGPQRAQVLARLAIKTKTPRGGSSRRRALTTGYKNFATQCSTPRTQRFKKPFPKSHFQRVLWRSDLRDFETNSVSLKPKATVANFAY